MRGNLDNTGSLVQLILRRERVMSTVWLVLLVSFSVGMAPAVGGMFDAAARASFAETFNNPAMVAMMGPVYGVENYTAGAMYSNAMLLWVVIAVGVMNIFFVIRHTRADEEKGRVEVVRSLPTGRLANLNATMISVVIVNVALALLTGLGIAMMGVESMDFAGSMLYGVVLGASGLFFAAVAALFAQLASSSRGAISFSFITLGAMYMLRAAGDLNSETLARISPMGLVQRTQVYVENYWWPIWVLLVETVAVVVISYVLNAIRDMDQGFIHAKPGRGNASPLLRSPFGLAFRLLRNTMIAWLIGMFALGASYGSIMGDIEEFVASSEFYSAIIGMSDRFTTAEMFVSMVTSILALCAIVPVLVAALKPYGEEKEGRTEHTLSRVVSRYRYLAGYTVLAFAVSILTQCMTAVGIYAAAAAVLSEPGDLTLGYLLKANLVYVPAIWVMIGLAVLLVGALPKAAPVIWAYFGFTAFAMFIGRLPDLLPTWMNKLTPLGYVPQLPMDDINYGKLAVLTVFAGVLTVVGLVCYGRRDTQG